MKKIKYKVHKIDNLIYAVVIPDNYDRAMTFLRVQEYYESDNSAFRGKNFDIWDYIKWYSTADRKGFTYPFDWTGFNIPYAKIAKCYQKFPLHFTPYDTLMLEIWAEIKKDLNKDQMKKAYVIGVQTLDSETFLHEVCHALYATNEDYKELITEVIEKFDKATINKLKQNVVDMGYSDKVAFDEVQAYLRYGFKNKKFSKNVSISKLKKYNLILATNTVKYFIKPALIISKQERVADKALWKAWQHTYNNRDKRVD